MKLKHLVESQFPTSKEEVEVVLKNWGIQKYTINDDLTVDVANSVVLSYRVVTVLPIKSVLPIKFGKVNGNFYCSGNPLTSLIGAPREVGGNFYCDNNQLTSLDGAPREVGGDFNCLFNKLKSLDGIGNVGELISDLS